VEYYRREEQFIVKQMPLIQRGITSSRLAIGCMGFGGSWDASESYTTDHVKQFEAVVDAALSIEINFFDHADIYTRGKAERIFGEILKDKPSLRDSLIIQSKCGIQLADGILPGRYNFSKDHLLSSVDGILDRLSTEYIDILLLHRPDPLLEPEEVAEALHILKSTGKVKYFGVSNMHTAQMRYIKQALADDLIVNQLHLSLEHHDFIDQGLLVNRREGSSTNFEQGLMEYMQLDNIQIQAWGPLAQGRYTGASRQQTTEAELLTAQLISKLANEKETTKEAILLGWLMRHPAMIQPILGTTNAERVLACQDAERQASLMSRDEWWELYSTANGSHKPSL